MSAPEYAFGFIGLGLIGGSIAKAIRKVHPDARITAYNPSRTSLDEAVADGVVDSAVSSIDDSFRDCHWIFLCAPVGSNADNLPLVAAHMASDAILTDIGSVKSSIHDAVVREGLCAHFIGGHPMAGSERTKYRNSRADLLENAYYILAPEPEVPDHEVAALRQLVRDMRAIPLVLSTELHDYATGAVSHVPHVISATLVNLVRECDTKDEIMKSIYAKGRDNARTPMQWDDSANAGFTTGTPWIKVNDNYDKINAKSQVNDPDSIFSCYKKLVQLRKDYPVFVDGKFTLLLEDDENIFAYSRKNEEKTMIVVCNFFDKEIPMPLAKECEGMEVLISNYKDTSDMSVLRPYEARMYIR